LLTKIRDHLNQGQWVRTLELSVEDQTWIASLQLLTNKPVLYIANVDESGFGNNPHLDAVKTLAEKEKAQVVVICAALESEIAELPEEEKGEFLASMGMS